MASTDCVINGVGKLFKSAINTIIFNQNVTVLVDSGAGKSCISRKLLKSFPRDIRAGELPAAKLYSAGGELLEVSGVAKVPIQI